MAARTLVNLALRFIAITNDRQIWGFFAELTLHRENRISLRALRHSRHYSPAGVLHGDFRTAFAFIRRAMALLWLRHMDEVILAKFNEFVKRRSLRRTTQRDSIVRIVFAKDEHFTAEELFEWIRRTESQASRATVYRTISLLVDAGLLREIDLGGEQKTYDPNFLEKPSHNHLVCVDCGKVVEFEDAHVDLLNDCITRRLGFRAIRQSIHIEGGCEQLRLKGRCPNLLATRLSGKRIKKR